ncbi:MAG: hypothetical protein HYX41_02755 [Bdellovibrio sp.]|nr:hypothetical protein [Bdellovibrio sp.]
MMECRRCGNRFPETGLSSLQPLSCPHCGASQNPEQSSFDALNQILQNYFKDLRMILTEPARFFKQLPMKGGLSGPLAFALVTHWIGSTLSYIWKVSLGTAFFKFSHSLFQVLGDVVDLNSPGSGTEFILFRDRIFNWITGAGPILIDPFMTLISILFTSFLVFVGARILVPAEKMRSSEITYESAVRIVAFGLTPAILAALPLVGGIVSYLLTLLVTIIGAKEVYQVSTARGVTIALFPKLLFLGIMAMGLSLVLFTLLRFFTSIFT